MLIKTPVNDEIIKFLKKDYLTNLNILGVLENVEDAEIYVDDTDNPTGVFVKKNPYMHLLYSKEDQFIEKVGDEYLKTGFWGFSGVEESIAEKIMAKYDVHWESSVSVYYMPKENLDKNLIENSPKPIELKDAAEVNEYYKRRSDESLQMIKKSLSNRPSSAVYVGDEMVCWVLIHDDNSMGIMYTKEDHRRKGFAVDVTMDLASKIFDQGKVPFIQIEDDNDLSPGLAKKCGFVEFAHAKWFGIIVGIPEELKTVSIRMRQLFLDVVGKDLEGLFYHRDKQYQGMYLTTHKFNENYTKDISFQLINPLDNDKLSLWSKSVESIFKMNQETSRVFNIRILEETSKGQPAIVPLLGFKNGEAVSVSALIELEEETYGVCCLGVVDNDISLLELTLKETLRLAKEKYAAVVFIHAPDERLLVYKSIGFKSL